jgi:hypothetical protein
LSEIKKHGIELQMISPEAAIELCGEWLRGEEAYQFGKYGSPSPEDYDARIRTITEDEVPGRWHRYRQFRAEAPDQASQAMMKVCASARAAAIIGQMAHRHARYETASWTTLNDLKEISGAIVSRLEVLTARLSLPFEIAMSPVGYDDQTLQIGYRMIAGLAVAHIMDDARTRGELWLPEPGHTSGEIVAWTR